MLLIVMLYFSSSLLLLLSSFLKCAANCVLFVSLVVMVIIGQELWKHFYHVDTMLDQITSLLTSKYRRQLLIIHALTHTRC